MCGVRATRNVVGLYAALYRTKDLPFTSVSAAWKMEGAAVWVSRGAHLQHDLFSTRLACFRAVESPRPDPSCSASCTSQLVLNESRFAHVLK